MDYTYNDKNNTPNPLVPLDDDKKGKENVRIKLEKMYKCYGPTPSSTTLEHQHGGDG